MTSAAPPPGPSADQAAAAARSPDGRLARVHLRGGLLTLARAELEQMAGAGTLDREAMADLAEVRWRSGDLEGAADAARAHQELDGAEPLAALVVAEELARSGREEEARSHAAAVDERVGGAFDVLFASEARASLWPPEDDGWMVADAAGPGHWGLLVGGSEVARPDAAAWQSVAVSQPAPATMPPTTAAPEGRGGLGHVAGASSTSAAVVTGRLAGEELQAVAGAIERGDTGAASQRLAVLLRLDPALAPVILSEAERAIASAPAGASQLAALHLVRGDAYRTLGRDNEAAAAFQQAHQALSTGAIKQTGEPT